MSYKTFHDLVYNCVFSSVSHIRLTLVHLFQANLPFCYSFFFFCRILVIQPGIELAVKMLSTEHWTTTEIPFLLFLKFAKFASDLVLYSCFSLVHDTPVQLVFNTCTLASRFVLLLSLQSVFL